MDLEKAKSFGPKPTRQPKNLRKLTKISITQSCKRMAAAVFLIAKK